MMARTETIHPENPQTEILNQMQRKLLFYQAWERLILRISPLVSRDINLDGFLRATVTEIGRLMTVDRCNLMVYSDERTLKIDYEYLGDPSLLSTLNLEIPVNRDFLLSSAYKNESFAVNDVQTQEIHPVVQQMCNAFGTQSLLIVPITLGDQRLALIGLHHCRQVHHWQDDERAFIHSLADQLAVAYQYARLFTEKEREVKISHLLLSLIDELYQQRDIDQVIAFLLDQILALITAECGCFGHIDLQGHTAHFTLQHQTLCDEETSPIPETPPFSPESALFVELQSGSHVFITQDSHLAHDGYRLRKAFGASSILLAPLLIKNALFGVMVFLWRHPGGHPEEDDLQILESVLRQASLYFERNQLVAEILHLKKRLHEARTGGALAGSNPEFQEIIRQALDLAPTETTICILGESGTGRTLLAELIHKHSLRDTASFRKISCRNLSLVQFREKVFGRSFTDKHGKEYQISGAIESTRGGSVFFHEIDCLTLESQMDLLEFLKNGYFHPEGSRRRIFRDHRLIFSTGIDLQEKVSAHTFSPTLWERIAQHALSIPPLRKRTDDISLLVKGFLEIIHRETGKYLSGLDNKAEIALTTYSWPGNVRELRSVLEKASRHASGPLLTLSDIARHNPEFSESRHAAAQQITFTIGKPLEDVERAVILRTLNAFDGDKKKTANALGISRRTLYRKLEQYGEKQGPRGEI